MKKLLVFILLIPFTELYSQQLVSTSSAYVEKDGIKITWSIGEVVIGTVNGTANDIQLTQGFLQPLLIDIFPTGIEEMYRLDMIAYPNPVFDKVLFKGEDPMGEYHIRLVDKMGKVLFEKKLDYKDLSVDMSKYNYGTYFIEVVESGTYKRRVFSIIKSSER